jgi:hypothetical protein
MFTREGGTVSFCSEFKSLGRREFLTGLGVEAISLSALSLAGCGTPKTSDSGNTSGSDASTDAKAGDWLGSAPEVDESTLVATYDTEIVVVGAGTAGSFAACAAVENGAKCILVERQSREFIGNGVRDTLAGFNTKQQLAAAEDPEWTNCVPTDKWDIINEKVRQSNGYGDDRLYKVWADYSGETLDWYTERLKERNYEFLYEIDKEQDLRYRAYNVGHSIQWQAPDGSDYSFSMTAGFLRDYAEGLGLETHNETTLTSLIVENGKVLGMYAETLDGIVRYNASKGVIICTGGYPANTEMLNALQPETVKLIGNNFSFPSNTGQGIKACLWAGGVLDECNASMIFDRNAIPADALDATAGEMFWMGSQPFLKVDLNGKRFTNESGPYDFILHDSFNLPHQIYCTVWDADYAADIERFGTHGCSRLTLHDNGTLPVFPLDYIEMMNADFLERNYIVEADTIEGLAEKLGIPAAAFKTTVERYNELFDAQKDDDFGKEAFRLSQMRTAPFKGVRQIGGYFITTLDGIKINTDMQVVRADGTAIEGLYCAGDCSGGYNGNSYVNLLAGDAAGRSVTFGRRAGTVAAGK